MQRWLIAFDCEAIVSTFLDDLFGNFPPATHRIDRYQSTGNLDDFQQLGDGRDLVAFFINHSLFAELNGTVDDDELRDKKFGKPNQTLRV